MIKQSLLVFSASMVLNICGFAAHAVASRQLGVTTYGELYALINAAVIAALPAAFVAPVVAQLAAEFRALHDDGHLRGLTDSVNGAFSKLALIYLVMALLGLFWFARFLHVPAWRCRCRPDRRRRSVRQRTARRRARHSDFGGYSLSNAAEGVAKVLGIGVLIAVGFKLGGAIFGFLLGPFCALIYLWFRLNRRYASSRSQGVRYDWRRIINAGAGAAAATIATALMGSADVVLVKHFFDAHAAGLYAAASLGGKTLLYLVGFVPTVLLPQAADRHARGETREVLFMSLLMFASIALCGLFIFKFFGTFVLHALVGHAFDAASPLLVTYGLAMVLLALTNALTYYGIATHRLAFEAPLLICTFGTLGAIATYHPSLATVVDIMAFGNAAAALAVAIPLATRYTAGRRSTV